MKVIDNAERPVTRGLLDPEKAYLAGKIVTDDLDALRRFRSVFPVNPKAALEVGQEVAADIQKKHDAGKLTNEVVADVAFLKLLPKLFKKDQAKGWGQAINFKITDAATYSIAVEGDQVKVAKGASKTADAEIKMDLETLTGIMNFSAMKQSGNIERVEIDDSEFLDAELGDDQLEAVAGGKGCGAEGGAAQACGADVCGAAGGIATACGAAACGAAGGAYTACGADACGAAVGYGTACGAAACAAAACAADACGAAVGAGACAGAACGAAVGAGVCAGNVCGADVLGGADVGPCGVNVIPCFPGI